MIFKYINLMIVDDDALSRILFNLYVDPRSKVPMNSCTYYHPPSVIASHRILTTHTNRPFTHITMTPQS